MFRRLKYSLSQHYMSFFTNVVIFLVIFFVYLHVSAQYKRSADLEIYETDYVSNDELQKVCNIKQPVLFDMRAVVPEFFQTFHLQALQSAGSKEVQMKDTNEYVESADSVDPMYLAYSSFFGLCASDSNSHYITENNHVFIDESGFYRTFQELDSALKPHFTVSTKYDMMMGSKEAKTPLRYHLYDRMYLLTVSGKIRVKMTPLNLDIPSKKDYENFEFWSPLNPWQPQDSHVKFLEFDVMPGYALYVPPYWYYSVEYSNCDENLVAGITYMSGMNVLANLPAHVKYYLQQSNIEKRDASKLRPVSTTTI